MRWILRIVINAIAIWVATAIVPGVHLTADDTTHKVLAFAVVGALFGIVNTVVRPVVRVVTFPFILLTFGVLLVVINALMLKLVGWLSGGLGIHFDAGPFWWSTIGAAIVVSIVSMILGLVFGDGKRDDHRNGGARRSPELPGGRRHGHHQGYQQQGYQQQGYQQQGYQQQGYQQGYPRDHGEY